MLWGLGFVGFGGVHASLLVRRDSHLSTLRVIKAFDQKKVNESKLHLSHIKIETGVINSKLSQLHTVKAERF